MSATTLKISDALKRRIVAAAKAAAKSPHTFMLEAIERQTRLNELRRTFVADAVEARNEAVESRQGYAAHDVRRYLMAVAGARDRKTKRPKPTTWRK